MAKKIIVAIALFVALLAGYYYCFVRCPGIALPFNEVSSFSREKEFLQSFPGNKWMQSEILQQNFDSDGKRFWERFYMAGLSGLASDPILSKPVGTGDKSFTCTNTFLIKISGPKQDVIEKYNAKHFGFTGGSFIFDGCLGINEKKLWVKLSELAGEWPNIKKQYALEIDHEKMALIAKHELGTKFNDIVVDTNKEIAFWVSNVWVPRISDSEHLLNIFDLKTDKMIETFKIPTLESIFYLDYNENMGLLLSTARYGKNDVFHFDPVKKTFKKILSGSGAKWGKDGYIYYTKWTSQLWRYKEGSVAELVFTFRKVPSFSYKFSSSLWMALDKSFLCFKYSKSTKSLADEKIVLFDMKSEEFRINKDLKF